MQKTDLRHETCPASMFDQDHPAHHNPSPASVRTTLAVFAEFDLALPTQEDLEVLTELAQSPAMLYWTAARYDPDPAEIELFVSFFVRLCSARPTLK